MKQFLELSPPAPASWIFVFDAWLRTQDKEKSILITRYKDKTDSEKSITLFHDSIESWTSNIYGEDNKYQYSVSNFTPNPAIADDYFTWSSKEHPGVEEVNLR